MVNVDRLLGWLLAAGGAAWAFGGVGLLAVGLLLLVVAALSGEGTRRGTRS